ncbi:hypothetical protein SADUNF_Sadunf14G0039100 [Salix dunnii]|uniref:Bifunctional inhibitor/plant lipid transfer protein/seed storage helical domain-containing protein n=1 Tax=Salix dunnii TaxID=1413687 RepID=A0A835MPN5_9ROSI|nr:hypothetical protein SADUNF_Sadunf14G0039100 [Salix dunnii]
MAFQGSKEAAIFVLLNVIFFTCVSSHSLPARPPKTPSAPKKPVKCPKDTLKFGVCGSWLGLVHEVLGTPPNKECCTIIKGLADLEAALCLCTAIKANVLGVVKLETPIAVSLLLSACEKKVPEGFKCAKASQKKHMAPRPKRGVELIEQRPEGHSISSAAVDSAIVGDWRVNKMGLRKLEGQVRRSAGRRILVFALS